MSRGNAGDNRDIKVSNDEGAHRKKLNYPLDKSHRMWYNGYSQEGEGLGNVEATKSAHDSDEWRTPSEKKLEKY